MDSSDPTDLKDTWVPSFGSSSSDAAKIAIVVTGMHRSGTSALTRILNLLGCDSARTLMPADQFNEKGYWESNDVTSLNDEILASAGSAWNDWEPLNRDWYASPKYGEFAERAIEVLHRQFGSSRLFVLKDPRFCRLVPFWRDALLAFGVQPMVVSPIREPAEVATSLLRRNGTNPSVAQLLWLRHVLDAEYDTRHLPRAYVAYADLLKDWQSVVQNVSNALSGLAWPRFSTTAKMEIESFLAPSLRHHVAAEAKAVTAPEFSPWIKTTLGIMNGWTRGDSRDSDLATLDRIRAAFDESAQTFARPIAEQNAHGSKLVSTIGTMEKALSDRHTELENKTLEATKLREDLENIRAHVKVLDASLVENERALSDAHLDKERALNALQRDKERALNASHLEREKALNASQLESERALHTIVTQKDQEIARALDESASHHRLFDEAVRSLRLRNEEFNDVAARLQTIETSTTWRASGALRTRFAGHPRLVFLIRRSLRLTRKVLHLVPFRNRR